MSAEPVETRTAPAPRRGIRASVQRVARHANTLVALHRELARREMSRKAGSLGAGAALAIAGAVVAFFAVAFGLAAAAAALAVVLDLWLALLILFVALLALAGILAGVGISLMRKAQPLAPGQALQEFRLTKAALRHRGS